MHKYLYLQQRPHQSAQHHLLDLRLCLSRQEAHSQMPSSCLQCPIFCLLQDFLGNLKGPDTTRFLCSKHRPLLWDASQFCEPCAACCVSPLGSSQAPCLLKWGTWQTPLCHALLIAGPAGHQEDGQLANLPAIFRSGEVKYMSSRVCSAESVLQMWTSKAYRHQSLIRPATRSIRICKCSNDGSEQNCFYGYCCR